MKSRSYKLPPIWSFREWRRWHKEWQNMAEGKPGKAPAVYAVKAPEVFWGPGFYFKGLGRLESGELVLVD